MKVNPYLNYDGQAEKAFEFYKKTFGGEYITKMRMKEAPGMADQLPDDEKERIVHISLPMGKDGAVLMASDICPSMGQSLTVGNNNYISLHPDSREEADRLFAGLSQGGEIEMPMEDQFWGDYFGSFKDKYGVCWMINHNSSF